MSTQPVLYCGQSQSQITESRVKLVTVVKVKIFFTY